MRTDEKCAVGDLFLLRHGATEWNRQGRYAGHTDLPLDRNELHRLNGAKEQLKNIRLDGVYCSDMQRAIQTLQEVCPDMAASAVPDFRLRELNFGKWEGSTYEQLKKEPGYAEWLANPRHITPPEGESMNELESRIRLFVQDLFSRFASNPPEKENTGAVLIVSHGGPIRMLITRLMPMLSFWDIDLPCGSLYRIGLDHGTLDRLA